MEWAKTVMMNNEADLGSAERGYLWFLLATREMVWGVPSSSSYTDGCIPTMTVAWIAEMWQPGWEIEAEAVILKCATGKVRWDLAFAILKRICAEAEADAEAEAVAEAEDGVAEDAAKEGAEAEGDGKKTKEFYAYTRHHLMGRVAYYVGETDEGVAACTKAIAARQREIDISNLTFYY
jgi:hypothetical protein